MRISLSSIAMDGGTQVRVQPDEATVADYAAQMTDGAQFPPVVLFHDGNQYFLADGFHRVLAARRNDWRDIDADVRVGTKTDALWFALAANKANGRRLTDADKKRAILLALQAWPHKTQTEIADQVGCTQGFVSQVISANNLSRPERVTGKDGKSYPASRGQNEEKLDAIRRDLEAGGSVHEVAKAHGVHTRLVGTIARDIGRQDKTQAGVKQRRKDIADMAARGFTTRQMESTIGLSRERIATIAREEGIVIHADRVVAGTRRLDANRVVEQTVMDAENLTADVDLAAFDELDPGKLGEWIDSLKKSQRALSEFVKRLIKEQIKHGQAA